MTKVPTQRAERGTPSVRGRWVGDSSGGAPWATPGKSRQCRVPPGEDWEEREVRRGRLVGGSGTSEPKASAAGETSGGAAETGLFMSSARRCQSASDRAGPSIRHLNSSGRPSIGNRSSRQDNDETGSACRPMNNVSCPVSVRRPVRRPAAGCRADVRRSVGGYLTSRLPRRQCGRPHLICANKGRCGT